MSTAQDRMDRVGAKNGHITETPQIKATASPTSRVPCSAHDCEEDELDDLDDVLDEFSATDSGQAKNPSRDFVPFTSGTEAGLENEESEEFPDVEDFATELQSGMAELLSGIDSSPEIQQQFEILVKELANATDPSAKSPLSQPIDPSNTNPPPLQNGEESFQATIQRTMERMRESSSQTTASLNNRSLETPEGVDGDDDQFLATLLGQFDPNVNGASPSDEDFSSLLVGMMAQLTNKEILYEPMLELHKKLPAYLSAHNSTLSESDIKRYKEQQQVVGEIVGRFEAPEYSDEKIEDREFIVERMQCMQAAGAPPPDLIGDESAAQAALGQFEQCAQQ
ncbi:MAG: Peroxisome chaperone and import receptor [Trizodia sp. TS-e1964]|nr:MAG: Peroxisome chaperone and import receptor [Trizodia sp. TS-e1964]